jgi:hypothetical protein
MFKASLQVTGGVICARAPFGKSSELPINEIASVEKLDHGFPTERLILRGASGREIILDRRFVELEITSMLTKVRALRPDLSILTEGLWTIRPQNGG